MVRLKDKDTFAGVSLASEKIGEGVCDLLPIVSTGQMRDVSVEMAVEDGKGTDKLKGALEPCKVQLEITWTPDKAKDEGGRLRVGAATGNRIPVDVVPDSGPLPGSLPDSFGRIKSGQQRQCGLWPFGDGLFAVCAQPRKPTAVVRVEGKAR